MVEQQTPRRIEALLGIDYGRRRIGLAVGQTITGTANPIVTVVNSDAGTNWDGLMAAIRQWRPDLIIVGLPIDLDGNETEMSREARQFADDLGELSGLPFEFSDERLTSVQADAAFVAARQAGTARRKEAKNRDSVAAQAILQQWLNEHA